MNVKNKEKARVPAKKAVVKKKIAAKKSTPSGKKATIKKSTGVKKKKKPLTRVSSQKKTTPKKAIPKKTVKPKIKRTRNKPVVEAVESNLPPVEEKSSTINNVMNQVPRTEMKKLRQKEVQNYNKHQIRLSSVKKGGPKPSGKKPLW
jgi:hypothetical protein